MLSKLSIKQEGENVFFYAATKIGIGGKETYLTAPPFGMREQVLRQGEEPEAAFYCSEADAKLILATLESHFNPTQPAQEQSDALRMLHNSDVEQIAFLRSVIAALLSKDGGKTGVDPIANDVALNGALIG